MLCLLTTSFNIARFEHENEVRRKALKPVKKWNPALFGIRNPLCWNPESSTRNPESKTVLDSLTWGEVEHEYKITKIKSLLKLYQFLEIAEDKKWQGKLFRIRWEDESLSITS